MPDGVSGAGGGTGVTQADLTDMYDNKAQLEANHADMQEFQMAMLDMQQRFSMDQFLVTTMSNLQKATVDTLKGIGGNLK